MKAEIREFDEAIDDAENEGNSEVVAHYKQQRQEFMQQVAGTIGPRGRSRQFASDHEKARSAVSKSMRRALDNIKEEHPLLYSHLKNALTLGSFVAYKPDRLITWQV